MNIGDKYDFYVNEYTEPFVRSDRGELVLVWSGSDEGVDAVSNSKIRLSLFSTDYGAVLLYDINSYGWAEAVLDTRSRIEELTVVLVSKKDGIVRALRKLKLPPGLVDELERERQTERPFDPAAKVGLHWALYNLIEKDGGPKKNVYVFEGEEGCLEENPR